MDLYIKTVCVMFVCVSCTTTPKSPTLSLDLSANLLDERPLKLKSDDLLKVVEDSDNPVEVVADIVAMNNALDLEESGLEAASKQWRLAVTKARQPFSEFAFRNWVRVLCKVQKEKPTIQQLSQLLLSETNDGQQSDFLIQKDLASNEKLASFLKRHFSSCFQSQIVDSKDDGAEPTGIPDRPGIPPGDPLLIKTAGIACKMDRGSDPRLESWTMTLDHSIKTYFIAIEKQCRGNIEESLGLLSEVAPRLSSVVATQHLGLESYSRIIKMRRDGGERTSVAPLFIPVMKLWKNSTLEESTFGWSRQTFELRRIEDSLSAARHQGIAGQLELAESYVNDALKFIRLAEQSLWSSSVESKRKLSDFEAEAMHFRSFRISVEKKDWDRAIVDAKAGLRVNLLSQEWKNRFQWSLGLYYFLSGDVALAKISWDEMLSEQIDESYKPMLLFWISRCHVLMGQASEASFYRKTLVEEFPLSFYSVVAFKLSGSPADSDWNQYFSQLDDLQKDLSKKMGPPDVILTLDSSLQEKIRRAELMAASKMQNFALMALDDVVSILKFSNLDQGQVELANYISRLYAASGNWVSAIALITKVSKYPNYWKLFPEQFLVYFPMPSKVMFETEAKSIGIGASTLMAVTRQETGFKHDAKSAAFAYGLMQITKPTARGLSMRHGIKLDIKSQDLLNPKVNVSLGSRYLLDLQNEFDDMRHLVFAAYNAGEAAVHSWQSARNTEDPLAFIELIPYSETRSYSKNVWRNEYIYNFLLNKTLDH
ncbi:MAG: lytic transglycosylase domain-containing protein [Proteobacteria bacterium]|nr:lytic transglycosylase domain-containing protein [Pseudomonadota bacterium]